MMDRGDRSGMHVPRRPDNKLARYRAALEAGADAAVVTGWIAETQAERASAEAELLHAATQALEPMSGVDIAGLVTSLGTLTAVLDDADPADEAEVYRQLGLRLTYHPAEQVGSATLGMVTSRPRVSTARTMAAGARHRRFSDRTMATFPADLAPWTAVIDSGRLIYVTRYHRVVPISSGEDTALRAVELAPAVALFRSLADPTRLAVVRRLADGEARVVDLTRELALAQSTVSAHLACLRDCGLVAARPQGRQMFYSLTRVELLDLLACAQTLLAATGSAVALCPNYGTGQETAG
jgi:DNA-binding transcriptional ArsR family regulator